MNTEVNVGVSDVQNNPHYAAAQERIQELRRMRELVPHFAIPASARDSKRLNNAASVPPQFVELTAVAMTHQNTLVRGDSIPPAEIRDLMSYGDAYAPLADELEALAQFIRHSVAAARHAAGTEALTTYALVRRLAKQPKNAGLAPYVTDMRRALGRVRTSTPEERAKKAAAKAARAAAVADKAAIAANKAAAALPPQQQS